MRDAPLTDDEIDAALNDLPGWGRVGHELTRDYRFADFGEALAFLVRGGLAAERLDHHPAWTNVYDRVRVRLCTHDAGDRVTARDVALAAALDRAAGPGAAGFTGDARGGR